MHDFGALGSRVLRICRLGRGWERLQRRWRWDGRHYARTAAAWLSRMDASRERLQPVFAAVYGEAGATVWWTRWRLFFLSVEELFAHDGGGQWWVSHYLFERR